jgi:predicted enzyme related to lactoylglutathione lyase
VLEPVVGSVVAPDAGRPSSGDAVPASTTTKGNDMNTGIRTVIYPVEDLPRAKAMYQALLGTQPYVDEPYYVGFRLGDQEFGLDPHGHRQGMTTYYQVDDLEDVLRRLRDSGAAQQGEVRNVGGGKLVVTLTDPDGNVVGLSQEP